MKMLILSLTLFFSLSAFSQHHDHPSVHGMLIAGRHKIYLSHLPMFHSPHDYQVILEVEFSSPGKRAYLQALDRTAETVYTLVPESFVLPEMVENPRTFRAQIFKGHFERGGEAIAATEVVISKVIYFKKFVPGEAPPAASRYLLFGNEQEQFIAHAITAKPDFDHIVSVKAAKDLVMQLNSAAVVPVAFDQQPNGRPLESSDARVEIIKSLYLEFGDLSH